MEDAVPICETDSGSDFSDQTSDADPASLYLNTSSAQSLNEETVVDILDSTKIVEHMSKTVADIAAIIEEDLTVTRLLLSHLQWDKQALIDRFYDQGKKEIFAEANITCLSKKDSDEDMDGHAVYIDALQQVPGVSGSQKSVEAQLATGNRGDPSLENKLSGVTIPQPPANAETSAELNSLTTQECGICMMAVGDRMFKHSCGHNFCTDCWRSYLTHSIMTEGLSQNITCAAYKCFNVVSDDVVMKLVEEEDVKLKYQQLISRSYVACNKQLRWCPGRGCDKAIQAETRTKQVTCICGERFCFQCGDKWHNPVQCNWIRDWNLKCSTDSSTASWLASNTKECPRCNATIEKDGGCNHMTCRTESCRYEFCWVCMGSWQEHGQNAWYRCNRFNEQSSKDARGAMEKSRGSMLRFLHYYSRFANHEQSKQLESDLYNKVNDKISELRNSQGQAWNEVKYLKMAVDVLCRAREILMITYIFAYFVVQNNQSMMFEDNQRDLELATEQLSEYLEREIFKDDIEGLKQKVNDKASYCGKRCAVLVSHVQEGYESGWWELCPDRRKAPVVT